MNILKKIFDWLFGDTIWYRNRLKNRHNQKCENCLNYKEIPKEDRDRYREKK